MTSRDCISRAFQDVVVLELVHEGVEFGLHRCPVDVLLVGLSVKRARRARPGAPCRERWHWRCGRVRWRLAGLFWSRVWSCRFSHGLLPALSARSGLS